MDDATADLRQRVEELAHLAEEHTTALSSMSDLEHEMVLNLKTLSENVVRLVNVVNQLEQRVATLEAGK
jgi:uncharacterized protein YjfI (DUF2170 family)